MHNKPLTGAANRVTREQRDPPSEMLIFDPHRSIWHNKFGIDVVDELPAVVHYKDDLVAVSDVAVAIEGVRIRRAVTANDNVADAPRYSGAGPVCRTSIDRVLSDAIKKGLVETGPRDHDTTDRMQRRNDTRIRYWHRGQQGLIDIRRLDRDHLFWAGNVRGSALLQPAEFAKLSAFVSGRATRPSG